MIKLTEKVLDISIEHPVHSLLFDPDRQRIQRIMRATSRPKPIRKAQEIHLVDSVEYLHDGPLDNLVFQRRNAERPQPPVSLRDIHPPRWFRPVCATMDSSVQIKKVLL